MNIPSKIFIVLVLMCISAAAYSQDCDSYLRRAIEMVSQKKYCDAKMYYQKYSKCSADADVSTEIAMCERLIENQKLDCGQSEPESKTGGQNYPIQAGTSPNSRTVRPEPNRLQVSAQKKSNEISVFGGGGLSFPAYQSPLSKISSTGYNCDFGAGFTSFFNQQCGVHTGVGFGIVNVKAKAGDIENISPGLTDSNGYLYDLYSTLYGYNETQETMSLYFPFLFQFQTKQPLQDNGENGTKPGFYAMAGLKLHLLLNRTYHSQITAFSNAAYYPEADNWAATQLFAGLGEFAGNNADGNLKTGMLAQFALETGIKWRIGANFFLYTGTYFDCGLNDPSKKERQAVSNYTAVEQLPNLSLLDVYKNSFLMNVGVRLRLAFSNK